MNVLNKTRKTAEPKTAALPPRRAHTEKIFDNSRKKVLQN